MRKACFFLAAILCGVVITSVAQAAPLPHPRIWVNSAILTRMQTARTNNTAEWQALQSYCDANLGRNIASGYQFLDWYAAVMNYGLAYRVSGNASYGSEGVKYLTALLRDRNTIGDGAGGTNAITVDSGYVARDIGTGVAVGRDWLDGASGMTTSLINECAARLNDWITWYNSNGYSRTDPTDNYYAGYFAMVYTASIGLEGDANYQSSWQTQAESMWTTVLGYMNGQGVKGDWLEGWNYGPWSAREYIGYPFALETGTTRDNHWSQTTWAADLVKSHIHMLYPSRAFFEDNGSWSGNYKGDPRTAVCLMCSIMSPNSATTKGLAVWFAHHLAWQIGSSVSEWEGLLYTDSSVSEVAPTAANMGGLAYLMYGHSVSRSADWTNLNATYVDVIGRPVDGEGDLNVGEVKMGSRGHILLIDGRTYEYNSDLGNVPDITGSHLYAPLQEWWHDAVTFNMDNVDSAYTYSKVNNVNTCYDGVNSENPDATYFRRDVAFMRPDFVAVFDNITTASTSNLITEKWYLAGQPSVNGATASITLGGAKLYTATVNPAVTVTSAANPGSRTPSYNPNEGFTSIYKLGISPTTPSVSNNILQLFEAADSTQGSMTAYDTLTPTGFIGAHIKHSVNPRIALFATAQNPAQTSCSFTFTPVASPTKVLLIGMQASTSFSVTITGSASKTVTVALGSGYTSTANGALSFDVASGAPVLTITTTSLPADTVGIAYNQTLAAANGTTPYTWSLSGGSLPAGLSLVAATGAITGTPTTSGTSSFTARVTDSVSATATQALSIVVNAAPSITTSSLPNGNVGAAYNQTLAATGGTSPLTWSLPAGSLPAGLSLVGSTGAITGSPTATGTSNFTAKVTDSLNASATAALSIVVNGSVLSITTSSLPADTVNVAYNQTLAAAGGTTPYTWAIQSGTLPAGLSLVSSTGAITGTPTASGASSFTAKVTDNAAATATKALSIVINAAPVITTASLPAGTVSSAYSQTLASTGGTSPVTWSIISGSLPGGLSLTGSTGLISGTPTASGTSNFTAKVTDNVGASATQALSITINAASADPTYQQASSDTETSTASTAWQAKTTLQFTPAASDTYVILAFGEYKASGLSYEARVHLMVDGTEEALANMMPQNGNEYYSFAVSKVATLSAAQHTLSIEYCTANAAQTTYLRRARIVAIRKASLEMYTNAADSTVSLNTTPADFAPITFTPVTAGDYLLIFTAETMGQWSNRAYIQPKLNSTIIDEGDIASRADVNYDSFASFCVATLPASSQTAKITAYTEGVGVFNARRFRVTAIRLTGDRFANYASIADDTQSGTTSTTFVQKISKTWTSGGTGNWLLLASARLQGTGGQTGEVQVNYNTSTTEAQPLRTFQGSNEWKNEDCVAVQNIVAGGRQLDTNYRSSSASYTVNIKYAHEVMLPLDSGGTPPSITTTSLPADTVGVAYNQTLAATGGTTPYTWSLQAGSLPAGLSLVASTGAITGTPTASGTSSFTAKVTDNVAATATQALSIVVNAAVTITTASLPADTINIAYNQTLAATGGTGALTWSLSAGSLPAGLSLVAGTGAITGTPTTAGAPSFTAKATDTLGASATKALSIVINAAVTVTTASLPADTINVAYSQTLAATGGTGALTWSLSSGSLPAGLSLSAGGVISGTPTAAGTLSFTARATDTVGASGTQALSIVINAAPSITTASLPADTISIAYSQTLASTGGTTPLAWSILSGSLPAGLSIVSGTGVISGTPTATGTSSFTAKVADNVGASASKALSIVINAAPSITTSSLPGGTLSIAYNQTLASTGGTAPLTWTISSGSLPAGLSLTAATGAITGTPTATGTSSFTARVTDNVGASATQALSIVITSGVTITTASLPADTVNIAYNQTLAASGGTTPYTWSIQSGSLPAGLSLVAGTGAVTGTPTASGAASFTAKVTDNVSATASKALSITINAAVTVTTGSLPADTIGVAYNQTLAATGGTGALTWSLSAGSLPAGLSLSSGGAITGTPTTSGTSSFTARATDTVGASGTKALSIVINATVSITTLSLPADTVNIAYSQTLAAAGGTTPLAWSILSGSLPAGLSIVAGTGVISGTPTATGTSGFTAKVTDNVGASATKALPVVINAAVSITTSSLPSGTVNTAYSQTLAATGGTGSLIWSLQSGSLPAGLVLSSGGVISGTPTASGTSSFTAKALDTVGASATKALAITISAAAVQTYYVATNGSDSYDGSSGTPWLTLQHAVGQINAGDTIIVRDGTYVGCRIDTLPGASGAVKSLKAEHHLGAILNAKSASATHNCVIELEDSDYWDVEDFKVNGAGFSHAVDVRTSGHVTVRHCETYGSNTGTLFTAFCDYQFIEGNVCHNAVSEHGFYASNSADYGTARLNTCYSNAGCGIQLNADVSMGGDGIMSNWLVEKNIVYNEVAGAAINLDGACDSKFLNNLLYNNHRNGIALFAIDAATGSARDLIYNNTIVNPSDGLWCISIATADLGTNPQDNKIKNCILMNDSSTRGSIIAYSSSMGANFQSDYNAVLDRFSVDQTNETVISLATWRGYGYDTHSFITTKAALFVDPTNNNYHLAAGSPAINSGTTVTEVTDDLDGNTRPQGGAYDVGCYEVVGSPLSITTTSLPADTVGVAYNQALAATGGTTPYTWSLQAGSLPAGLSLVAGTGAITGTPTTSGASSFTAKVTDNVSATATQALSIVINAAVSITTASLPADTVNIAYNQTLSATGGTGALTWALQSGSLPAGLSLSSGGAITGTPTTAGTSSFTAKATDTLGASATRALSIAINAAVTVTTASLPADTINVAYSQTLVATGGTGALTWSLSSGALPAGLSLNAATGAITGTPTVSGTSNFTAKAADTVGASGTKALSITINAAPAITTASLPAGTINTAYSQTLAASGGTTPYTWSVLSGSLPAGLSLNASTGAISGTPTATGTSNFTAKVTDNVAATASQALSIVINASAEPVYQFSASDTEASTSSTTFQTKTTLSFTPGISDDWVILAFAEIRESSASYQAQARLVVDGTVEGLMQARPVTASDYMSMSAAKYKTLTAAAHTITLQYASSSASGTAYVRYARIVALRKAALAMYQTASDSTTALTTTLTNYATLTFTAPAANDYLFIYSAEVSASTSNYTWLEPQYDADPYDDGYITAANNGDYTTFMSFAMLAPDTNPHTATLAAAKQGGSTTQNIRRARIIAIQLSGGRFANYFGQSSDAESTTTSTSFTLKKSTTWPQGENGNWLLLNSARIANSSTSYQTEVRSYLNSATVEAQELRRPKATSDYLNFTSIDVRNITTSRTVEIDYRTTNASGTAKIRRARLYQLPLD